MVEPLSIRISGFHGALLVAPSGEVDLATAPLLAQALGSIDAADVTSVTVTLADVTFVDARGLGCLVQGYERFREAGGNFVVCDATPLVRRVFEITGLDRVLFDRSLV